MGVAGIGRHDAPMTHTEPLAAPAEHTVVGVLRRPFQGRLVAGVAAGVAEYLDLDPVLVRVALVVLTFFGGVGILAYAAAWALVPEEGASASVAEQCMARFEGRWS